jgi:hypothetical protein
MRATEAISYWNWHKRSKEDKERMTHYTPGLNREDSKQARKKSKK